ncbi:MAG: SDR family NAD(P)-dependent oxidoreductase [Chitinophagaceae bacterium]
MNKIVFITGATSGFGKAAAEKFAAHQYDLIITGRREPLLLALQKELENKYGVAVLPLVFDVRDREAVAGAISNMPDRWIQVDVLLNNAGLALGRDYINEGNIDDWDTMLDTNVKGLLYVSKAVLPLMTARNQGHIINLGSVAAKDIYEKGNVYCASKAAVDAISRGMRVDLLKHHIKVTAIHPGAAETEFSLVRFKGDGDTAKKIYDGFKPLSAEDVADVIYYCASLPPHVCVNDLVITCTAQADGIYIFKE